MKEGIALRFSRFFIRHSHFNLAVIGALTLFFGYHALQLQVFSQFIDLLPRNHPYIQVYEKYNRDFGSANRVAVALIANEGTIYDARVLEKVYGFTDQIDKIEGVDHGQINSIAHVATRGQSIDREGVLRSEQVLGSETISVLEAQFLTRRLVRSAREEGGPVPGALAELQQLAQERVERTARELGDRATVPIEQIADPAEAEEVRELRKRKAELELLLRRLGDLEGYRLEGAELIGPTGATVPREWIDRLPDRIRSNPQVYGRLVSEDESATLVLAGFVEGRLDYERIFGELQALEAELEADGLVDIHLSGQPVLVGWTFEFLGEIILILFLSVAVLIVLLGVYFRRWYGLVLPLTGAAVSAVWGLGFISLMGYQLEPLVLVIPMLITARAISHSVQFVERFFEDYEELQDKHEAVVRSMAELLLPGTLAILTDAFGIFVIGVSSIALMKKLAFFGAFWALSIAVTEMLLNRLMIVYLPPPRTTEHYVWPPVAKLLRGIGYLATNRRAAQGVFAVWLVAMVGAAFYAPYVKIGEPRPGTPILYPDHPFNQSVGVIASQFYGADELILVVETPERGGVHRPEVMREIEALQRHMERDPKVGGTLSVVDFTQGINRALHNGDPRWAEVPATPQEIGGMLYFYEAGSPDPRVLNPYRDPTAQTAAVRVFYADHQGETVAAALDRARQFAQGRPAGNVAIALETPREGAVAALYRWLGPLLPPRSPELVVQVAKGDGDYARADADRPDRTEPPPEDSAEWIQTLPGVTRELWEALRTAGYESVQQIAGSDPEELAGRVEGYDLATAFALIKDAGLDRRSYQVTHEWQDDALGVHAQVRHRGLYEPYELWVRYQGRDWERRESLRWSDGASVGLASGLLGVLAASNEEVEASNNATLVAAFSTTFLVVWLSYRAISVALLMIVSLGSAALLSLAYMYFADIGFDVNTLPVQALGVGVGVDYALYIMDRVVRERRLGKSLEEALRTAINTTGMAVFFTASTLIGGIIFWYFVSSLRFAADMSLLLGILLFGNMLGAVLLVPAFTALFRPQFAVATGAGTPDDPGSSDSEGVNDDESEQTEPRVASASGSSRL